MPPTICDIIDEKGPRYVCKKITLDKRDYLLDKLDEFDLQFMFRLGLYKEEILKLFTESAIRKKLSGVSYETMMLSCDIIPCSILEKNSFREQFLNLSYSRIYYYSTYHKVTTKNLMNINYLTNSMICKVLEKSTISDIQALLKSCPYLRPLFKCYEDMISHSIFPIRNGTSFDEKSALVETKDAANRAYCKEVVSIIMSFLF